MKILAIRGKNLASLAKEFEVDFGKEPLKSAGLFAITGCTGSGKSTLLDALCLALFDKMPRTSQVSEKIKVQDVKNNTINQSDSRTILRRGAVEGYAEVDFLSLEGEYYRSRWSVRRARNNAEGALMNTELRLLNLTSGKDICSVKTDILAQISGLIGLSYEQFARSVLLAQGDFATFLKARQSEKAELLEKLTGTDIYSRISIAIFEKTKKAEADWNLINERIRAFELLSQEQINAYSAELKSIKQELTVNRREVETLTTQLKWIADNERIVESVRQAEALLASARNAIETAKSRYDYLAGIDSVQEIRDSFGLLKNAGKQLSDNKLKLQASRKQHEENNKLLAEADINLLELGQEQTQLTEKQKEITPFIIKARELDVLLKTAKISADETQKQYDAAKTSYEKADKNFSNVTDSLKRAENDFSVLGKWLAENSNYESISSHKALIISLITDAKTSFEGKRNNEKMLESNKSMLEENMKQSDALKQEAETLNNSLTTEIATLRAKLEEGMPCPVCGSTHHPAAKIEYRQQMMEKELHDAKERNSKQTEALRSEIDNRKSEIARLTAIVGACSEQYYKAYNSLENNLIAMQEWKEIFEKSDLKVYILRKTDEWAANNEKYNKAREEKGLLTENLKNEENKLKEARENFAAMTEKLRESKLAEQQLIAERANVLHGKPADAAEQYFIDKQAILTDKLKKANDNKLSYIAKQEGLNGTIRQIEDTIHQDEERIGRLRTEVTAWIESKEGITPQLLEELLSKDAAWIQAEKKSLASLNEVETTAKATYGERLKNLEQHNNSESKPQGEGNTKEVLNSQLEEKTVAFDKRNKRFAELEIALSNDAKAKVQVGELEKEAAAKNELWETWRKLNDLIGSASGNKFKEIAQGYTLDTLLVYANKHLEELSPRYVLQRIPDTLALQIVDTDMLNEVRTVHSLSGGESFLISLALALGLSSLSSNRMKVESLFIDEGFGSLDSDTLRIAMDVLERLRTQGRKIGVISHVTEMTERIPVQIQVVKTSNGKSEIKIKG
ncbi:MAG: AAA family ATPase [Tannerella sp.]|jgi:exonuclease SbcC|nr:AAA family ATPase [Tannerella sp.]